MEENRNQIPSLIGQVPCFPPPTKKKKKKKKKNLELMWSEFL